MKNLYLRRHEKGYEILKEHPTFGFFEEGRKYKNLKAVKNYIKTETNFDQICLYHADILTPQQKRTLLWGQNDNFYLNEEPKQLLEDLLNDQFEEETKDD